MEAFLNAFKGISIFIMTVVMLGGTPLALITWQDNRKAVAKIFTPKRNLLGLLSILAFIVLGKWVLVVIACVAFPLLVLSGIMAHDMWVNTLEDEEPKELFSMRDWLIYSIFMLTLLLSKDEDSNWQSETATLTTWKRIAIGLVLLSLTSVYFGFS